MGFATAVGTCLRKYASFKGRAPRSEYWYFVLFNVLALFVATILDQALQTPRTDSAGMLFIASYFALLPPGLAVMVRRLHDTGRSGWWFWFMAIPILGWVFGLVWLCLSGQHDENRFGPAWDQVTRTSAHQAG